MPSTKAKPVSVVTGGAGFLGSHLTDRLLMEGHRVIAIDNLITGNPANIGHLAGNPDFARLAEAYGCAGIRVTRPDLLESAVRQALAVSDRPVVVDIMVSPEENVYPMIPAGTTIDDMIVEGPHK